jgi:hypothetical protein
MLLSYKPHWQIRTMCFVQLLHLLTEMLQVYIQVFVACTLCDTLLGNGDASVVLVSVQVSGKDTKKEFIPSSSKRKRLIGS